MPSQFQPRKSLLIWLFAGITLTWFFSIGRFAGIDTPTQPRVQIALTAGRLYFMCVEGPPSKKWLFYGRIPKPNWMHATGWFSYVHRPGRLVEIGIPLPLLLMLSFALYYGALTRWRFPLYHSIPYIAILSLLLAFYFYTRDT